MACLPRASTAPLSACCSQAPYRWITTAASLRFAACGPLRVAAGARALLLAVRGDGQVYKLSLKADDSNATGQYQASFTVPREWTSLRFVPTDFAASFRGRALAAPTIVLGEVQTVGLLITDKQVGAFRIEVRSIGVE